MIPEEIAKHKPLTENEEIQLYQSLLLIQKLSVHERDGLKRLIAGCHRTKELIKASTSTLNAINCIMDHGEWPYEYNDVHYNLEKALTAFERKDKSYGTSH